MAMTVNQILFFFELENLVSKCYTADSIHCGQIITILWTSTTSVNPLCNYRRRRGFQTVVVVCSSSVSAHSARQNCELKTE